MYARMHISCAKPVPRATFESVHALRRLCRCEYDVCFVPMERNLIGREQEALGAQHVPGQTTTNPSSETSRMRASDIHAHWQDWAVRYGTDLRATTIASSIKRLEIAALHRAIERVVLPSSEASILEIGCGNGQNLVALAKIFADQSCDWAGVD